MLLPALFYIVWDMIFVKWGVWSFNEKYITGIKLYNLPLEEVLFFFVVPYCCIFIYECIRCYFPSVKDDKNTSVILQFLGVVLLITGIIFYEKKYTACTFIFTAVFIFGLFIFNRFFSSFHKKYFLLSYLICIIPFVIVNGFLTAIPVVMYNDNENLGIRLYTIPFEDIFYGMLLMMMNIAGYEKLRCKYT